MVKVREWLGFYIWTNGERLKEIEQTLATVQNNLNDSSRSTDMSPRSDKPKKQTKME